MPIRHLCDFCQSNITNLVYISCAECPELDLCVPCFAKGSEKQMHIKTHPYRDKLTFPVYESDWGADEEYLLLEAIELHGLGNWSAIADHIGSKTKEQCEKHYMDVYILSSNWPHPEPLGHVDTSLDTLTTRKRKRPSEESHHVAKASHPYNHEVQGYMPARGEFETEYENDAENQVKDIYFMQDEPDEETELKLALLDIYNQHLNTRDMRKAFLVDNGLVEYRKMQTNERKYDKEDRELLNKVKVYAKMMTKEDFDEFVQGLIDERRLRKRIAELQEYRLVGLRTLQEGTQYEQLRLLRMSRQQSAVTRESATYSTTKPRPVEPIVEKKTAGRKQAQPLDISHADDVHLLSDAEVELCSMLRILPRPYLIIKEQILSVYSRKGVLRKRDARDLVKIDVNKTGRIYDFFIQMGWLKPPATTLTSTVD